MTNRFLFAGLLIAVSATAGAQTPSTTAPATWVGIAVGATSIDVERASADFGPELYASISHEFTTKLRIELGAAVWSGLSLLAHDTREAQSAMALVQYAPVRVLPISLLAGGGITHLKVDGSQDVSTMQAIGIGGLRAASPWLRRVRITGTALDAFPFQRLRRIEASQNQVHLLLGLDVRSRSAKARGDTFARRLPTSRP